MTSAAPSFGNSTTTNYGKYVFPPTSEVPRYESHMYPYLNSTDPAQASQDPDYRLSGSEYLPAGYNDALPQPILPAGGGPGGKPRL